MKTPITPFTLQSAFDAALLGIRRQNYVPSASETRSCKYRGPGGLRCAAGHIIPDGYYNPDMEGSSWQSLHDDRLDDLRADSVKAEDFDNLITDLQNAHDNLAPVGSYKPSDWELKMSEIARVFKLDYTRLPTAGL